MTVGGWLSAAQASSGQLAVEVSGFNTVEGQLCVRLFPSSHGFPGESDRALQSFCTAVAEETQVVTFEDVEAGTYAVALFHDINGDNAVNRNFLGMPVEGVGFSRNPTLVMGPPDFEEAVILVAGTATDIQIQLRYF